MIIRAIFIILTLLSITSCKTKTVYVPIESVRTEWRDKEVRDSIYLQDSIIMKLKGDTVWLEKYRYLYRDKLVRDSIFLTDSIQVPYPVVEYKEVNKLTGVQNFLVYSGLIAVLLLIIQIFLRYYFKR